MNKIFKTTLITLICTVIIAAIPTEAEAKIYQDTVRLHILADSDSEIDQALKIKVRDRILYSYKDELSLLDDTAGAKEYLEEILPEAERLARGVIEEEGFDYTVKVEIVYEWFDTRDYGSFTLPCGYYSALRIIIGQGKGQNWWCVMYPPMCLDIALGEEVYENDDYTYEENLLITNGRYKVKFKLLELLSKICQR